MPLIRARSAPLSRFADRLSGATPGRLRSGLLLAVAVALLAGGGGCRGEDSGSSKARDSLPSTAPEVPERDLEIAHDLLESFVAATPYVNTTRLDFGSPESQAHLMAGWGVPETTPQGPVQWAMGRRSSFWIFSADRRALRMTWRIWPHLYAGAPPQKIDVFVNGRPLTQLELEPRPRTYHVDVPEEMVVAGRNSIAVEHTYSGNPDRDREGRDTRPLAVLWDWLQTDLPASEGMPRTDAASSSILLPPASGVDFFFKLPAGAELALRALERLAGGDTRPSSLVVRATADGPSDRPAAERHVALPLPADGAVRVPIEPSGIVRLSLLAPPAAGDTARLVEPVIRVPRRSAAAASAAPIERPAAKPNVVIYLIDALRADHLGVYGYEKPVSPAIDAFAAEAAVFVNAFAQTSWTRPAVASILTGLSIPTHGIIHLKTALSRRATTIAEILHAAGYGTTAFTLNAQISRETGFDQGFDHYTLGTSEPEFDRQLHDHLAGTAPPFFAYVHTIEPHTPYEAEPPLMERFAPGVDSSLGSVGGVEELAGKAFSLIYDSHFVGPGEKDTPPAAADRHEEELLALYDAEVASADARFARFLDRMRELDLYDDTVLILLADHGEEFYDHGRLSHGMTLYGEQTRIPLIMRLPNAAGGGRRIDARVSQIDILPTVLDYLRIDPPPELEGRSLLPLLADGAAPWQEAPAFSYLDWFGGRAHSVVAEGAKLIHNLEMYPLLRPAYELYDLRADPRERNDIAAERPILVGYLASLMKQAQNRVVDAHQPEEAVLDPAFQERMRALGYME